MKYQLNRIINTITKIFIILTQEQNQIFQTLPHGTKYKQTLHPKILPSETSSRLATAQGSSLTNFGNIQLHIVATRTMEQNKLLSKHFKLSFHITDIKYNIVLIRFITKHIPTINILNSRIHMKDKYTRLKNTSLTFFHRLNRQTTFFFKFYPIYNQEQKHLKLLSITNLIRNLICI